MYLPFNIYVFFILFVYALFFVTTHVYDVDSGQKMEKTTI